MAEKIHYIMPMAGRGSRFSGRGFNFPKPLIEIYGKPFFYWSTQSIYKFIALASMDFIVLQEHIDRYAIDREIMRHFHNARIHVLPEVTEGAVVTCMKGMGLIDDGLPLIFNDCDHLFKCSLLNKFCRDNFNKMVDGIVLTFVSNEPKFSFVEKDNYGNVTRTAEKEVISNEAICGCYYFRNKDTFMSVAKEYLTKCNYTEYFISGVYNVMLERGMVVKSFRTDFHVPFGIPEEYEAAKKSGKYRELL